MTDPDQETDAIWAAMLDVYGGALAGDRRRVDAHLDPGCTFWDSHSMPLVRGLTELDGVRDARSTDPAGTPVRFEAVRLDVRIWDGTALLIHAFRLFDDGGATLFTARNSSVWRGSGARWSMVHDHEDVVAEEYWPA